MNLNSTFEIKSTFTQDIESVFEMWTNPDSFSRWLGPDGAEMKFLTANVAEGGSSFWTMNTADGLTKFGKIDYKAINPNHLLVYTQHFCDAQGNFIKAPFSETYPDTLLTIVRFTQTKT